MAAENKCPDRLQQIIGELTPEIIHHRERERITRESHAEFKERRVALRNQIVEHQPLFGFYRDLLRWLFLSTEEPAPRFRMVEIVVED